MNTRLARSSKGGFSLIEITTVVAIIGILSSLAMVGFWGSREDSMNIVAGNRLEYLNEGLKKYSQIDHTIENAEVTPLVTVDDTAEEVVLGMLQADDITVPGSPFIDPRWDPEVSDITTDHRLQWTGSMFQLILPGTAGSGLKVDFSNSDF